MIDVFSKGFPFRFIGKILDSLDEWKYTMRKARVDKLSLRCIFCIYFSSKMNEVMYVTSKRIRSIKIFC